MTTTVYRKSVSNGICLKWNAFTPTTCKRMTLKTLVEPACVFSQEINF